MAIKIAPKPINAAERFELQETQILRAMGIERRKRKPTGKAKEAVTVRLPKDCVVYFQTKYGEEWRAKMQDIIENAVTDP